MATVLCGAAGCGSPPGGVVSAASPGAARAGVEILERGGNAVDAAVAVQLALAVTEPAMSGLGGQTQIVLQRPGEAARVINGTSFSPAATPLHATRDELTGIRGTTIPATVRTLEYAWRHFGSGRMTWADLVAPAIRLADDGFVVGPFRHAVWRRHADDLAADTITARLFLVDGAPPAPDRPWAQPTLARTLQRLAEGGADAFYRGDIAHAIAEDMAARGGWITAADLARLPEPQVQPAITASYREYEVATLPPPGGGWVVLHLLNLFELADAASLQADAPTRVPTVVDALRLAHTSRRHAPVADFDDYGPAVAAHTAKDTARARWARRRDPNTAEPRRPDGGETTHFTVVDRDGLVVSTTASINSYFGSRTAHPTLGFLYNSYMLEFERDDPTHPFALRPGARPYSSMSPTIVSREGRPVLAVGSPGSARIISAVAQVVQRWVDGAALDAAVAAPRWHAEPDGTVYAETGASTDDDLTRLRAAGYRVEAVSPDLAIGSRHAYFGGVHGVAWERGVWVGAADPRRDGVALSAREPDSFPR